MIPEVVVFGGCFVLAAILSGGVRRYALAKRIMDVPNGRSSHAVSTPRGGGLAVVAVASAGFGLGALLGFIEQGLAVALVGGGALVAAVGWIDDRSHVPARWRGLVHLTAAVWALFWVGGLSSIRIFGIELSLWWVGSVLSVIGVIWLINLYNFMDGIDGLAGGEAVLVGLVAAILCLGIGAPSIAVAALVITGAAMGFLVWNWAPAKIFMGDVGSGTLGYFFAVLAIASENSGALPLVVWVVLLGVFAVDATVTLVRRVVRKEKWYDAHRLHAYQRLVQAGWTHRRTTSAALALTGVLGLLAVSTTTSTHFELLFLPLSLLLLVVSYLWVEHIRPMYPEASPLAPSVVNDVGSADPVREAILSAGAESVVPGCSSRATE